MQQPKDREEQAEAERILTRCAQEYLLRRLRETSPSSILTLFWNEFYAFYAAPVARMVQRSFPAGPDREDLIQEVWLAVTRKLPDFCWHENRNGFRAWLTKVVHDKTVDRIRRRARRRATSLGLLPAEAQQPVDNGEPAGEVERRWQEEAVRTVLADLRASIGDVNHQILQLHYWGNHTVSQVAAVVGLTPAEVSARQYRLLKKVRARLLAYCGADFTPVL